MAGRRKLYPTKKYHEAFKALYSEKIETQQVGITTPKKSPPRPRICPTEAQEQFTCAHWLRKEGIPHHHSPNGGYRDAIEGAKFKRMGTSPGFPDLFIPLARNGYHGLFVELKTRTGGKLSPMQIEWGELLKREGYAWYCAKGFEEFQAIVENYLLC